MAISNQGSSQRKPIKPQDNAANMQNPNKGTSGVNRQYDQNQGNRGKQLNHSLTQISTAKVDSRDKCQKCKSGF